MLFTGFRGLLRLGEMITNDNPALRDPSKYSLRSLVEWLDEAYAFWLRTHKTDTTFHCYILQGESYAKAVRRVRLDLEEVGVDGLLQVPMRQWFIRRLQKIVPDNTFAGQSLQSGGTTFLTEQGVSLALIQSIGGWSSETFQIYIRKNPVLLQIMLDSHRADGTRVAQ
ncbi:hypothetical protein C8J56DRAFT_1086407 [Mycena floridula]|nr:hypothetical protein C8J56DRAFT_1086407 [Mycena floridula]